MILEKAAVDDSAAMQRADTESCATPGQRPTRKLVTVVLLAAFVGLTVGGYWVAA